MTEAPGSPDVVRAPERTRPSSEFRGLQGRFLITGAAINPDRTFRSITKDSFAETITVRNYSQFDNASTRERKKAWADKGETTEERQQQWKENTARRIREANPYFKKHGWDAVYQKLFPAGTDLVNFEPGKLDAFYNRYFIENDNKSNVKAFIQDVIVDYVTPGPDGRTKYDYDKIMKDLPAIKWLASTFGETSSEMIAQLIDAEIQHVNDPTKLLTELNTDGRINKLGDHEKELLNFVWVNGEDNRIIRTTNDRDGKRIFPADAAVLTLTEPEVVADRLIAAGKYPPERREWLIREVQADKTSFEGWKKSMDLETPFEEKILESITDYSKFLEEKYGIKPRDIQNLQVVLLSGKSSELYNKNQRVLGFVEGIHPAIFVDLDRVFASVKDGYTKLPPNEVKDKVLEVISHLNPHEYTHLAGDLSHWEYRVRDEDGEESINSRAFAKAGLFVAKRRNEKPLDESGELNMIERGRGFMEGLTVELTNQWKIERKQPADVTGAYPHERQVVDTLVTQLAEKRLGGATPENRAAVYKLLVNAYFAPNKGVDFRKFVRFAAGDKQPHLVQTIYNLMNYEMEANGNKDINPKPYELTLAYLNGTLTPAQKETIKTMLTTDQPETSNVKFTEEAKYRLGEELGLGLTPPTPGSRLEKILKHLKDESTPTPSTPPAATTTESRVSPPDEVLPEEIKNLQPWFEGIAGEVDKNGPYFIEKVPEEFKLTPEQLVQLEQPVPYFIPMPAFGPDVVSPNPRVAFSLELGTDFDSNEQIEEFLLMADQRRYPTPRFTEAEKKTHGDSGLHAIAAVSAATPAEQAKLYKLLAEVVIATHENNPELLKAWLVAQNNGVSRNKFMDFDDPYAARPDMELVSHVKDIGGDSIRMMYSPDEFQRLWKNRIEDLKKALPTGKLEFSDLRWLELLSHSVDVRLVLDMMK